MAGKSKQTGGWLYALDLRKRARARRGEDDIRDLQRTVTSCARTDVRKCS